MNVFVKKKTFYATPFNDLQMLFKYVEVSVIAIS